MHGSKVNFGIVGKIIEPLSQAKFGTDLRRDTHTQAPISKFDRNCAILVDFSPRRDDSTYRTSGNLAHINKPHVRSRMPNLPLISEGDKCGSHACQIFRDQ